MNDQAAGKRLRRYIKEGMASAGIETFTELAEKSGVGRDTLQAWMRGARAPSSGALDTGSPPSWAVATSR